MSNEDKHIDQLFKDKLSSMEFEIPDAFLDDLNAKLDAMPSSKNERKKGFFLWFWGVAGIAALFIGFLWFFSTNSTKNHSINQHSTKTEKTEQQNTTKKHSKKHTKQNTTEEETQNSKTPKLDALTDGNSLDNKNQTTEKINHQKVANSNQEENTHSSTSENSSVKSDKNIQQTNNRIKSNKKNKQQKENSIEEHNNSSTPIVNKENTEKKSHKEIYGNNTPNNENKTDEKETSLITDSSTLFLDTIKKVRYIDSVVVRDSVVIVYDTIKVIDSSAIKNKRSIKKVKKNNNSSSNLRIETQALFGMFSTKAVLSPKPLLPNEQIFISHSPITTTDAGAEINIYFKDISFTSGVKYMSWGDKYSYNTNSYKLRDTIAFVGYDTTLYIDSNNVIDTIITPIYDSITVTDTLTFNNSEQRKYNRLVIPLKLGYTFSFGSWSIIPKAGINVEVNISNKNTTEFQKPALLKRMGASYVLQMDIRRKFGDKYIYISPVYRQSLTPLIKSDASYHVFKAIGIQFGMGFTL